jgi:thioesterase domain-containing protein
MGSHLASTIFLTLSAFLAALNKGFAEERRHRYAGFRNLAVIQTGSTELPALFWIHGDATDRHLHDLLGPTQPLCALKHQGRHGEPVEFLQVEIIAQHYLSEIRMVQPQGPYCLGGFSFGATVAFEIARQLHRAGDNVTLLFMIDPLSPGTPVSESSGCSKMARSADMVVAATGDTKSRFRKFLEYKGQQKFKYIIVGIKVRLDSRLKPLTKALNKLTINYCLRTEHTLPHSVRSQYILSTYYTAIAEYKPEPYGGTAIYIRASRRSMHYLAEWRKLFPAGLEVHELPGNHMDLIKDEAIQIWIETLKSALGEARRRTHGSSPRLV